MTTVEPTCHLGRSKHVEPLQDQGKLRFFVHRDPGRDSKALRQMLDGLPCKTIVLCMKGGPSTTPLASAQALHGFVL